MVLTFFVPGIPVPGGSKRGFIFTPKGGGKPRVAMSDASGQRGKDWRAVVQLAARAAHQGAPLAGPLSLAVNFVLPRPKKDFGARGLKENAPRYPTTRPDATKLLRALEDACTGILWADDACIVKQVVAKVYGEETGALIEVRALPVGGEPDVVPEAREPGTLAP